jgi:hypothetical protein
MEALFTKTSIRPNFLKSAFDGPYSPRSLCHVSYEGSHERVRYLIDNGLCRVGERFGIGVDEHRISAFGADKLASGGADARAATGDEHHLALNPVYIP